MKKEINSDLTLYFNNIYPYKNSQKSIKYNIITIGVGGNIGDVSKTLKKLFKCFLHDGRFKIIQTSPILKNPPFGYLEQDDFLNAIIVLKTNLSSKQALRVFQRYENRFKRVRSFQNAPRTLDIDIIFFNNLKIKTKELTIPHIGFKSRSSVQIPLKYISNIIGKSGQIKKYHL